MKVFLVNPAPSSFIATDETVPPMGLAFLASTLEKAGHKVRIFDNWLFQNVATLESEMRKLQPDVFGISVTSGTYSNAKKLAHSFKHEFGVPVVFGGALPTLWPTRTLQDTEADVVVRDEGEVTTVELMDKLEAGGSLRNVKGISYKHSCKIKHNLSRPLIKNLDDLPSPAWHLLPMKHYPRRPVLPRHLGAYPVDSLNSSRGCPYGCRFCSLPPLWRTYRFFSPQRTVSDLTFLVDNYGTKGMYFREDNFTVNKKRVLKFCRLMREEKLDVLWMCPSRVDVDYDLLKAMKEAGCCYIWFGVESGCNRVLKLLNKGITVAQVVRAFKLCKKLGINAGGSYMIGVPGETVEEIHETIRLQLYLFRKFNGDFVTNIFTGIPTNPIYEEIVENGWYRNMEEGGICEVVTSEFNRCKLESLRLQFMKEHLYGNLPCLIKLFRRKLLTIKSVKDVSKYAQKLFPNRF